MASMIRSTRIESQFPPADGRRSFEASIGDRLKARTAEKATAAAMATASSTNRRPI